MIQNNTGARLYRDLTHLDRRYAIINNDLLPAVCYHRKLSAIAILVFMYISTEYEGNKAKNNQRYPVKISHLELEEKLKRSKSGVTSAIEQLISYELIFQVNEAKGRAKAEYAPNVENIHKCIDEYINLGL